MTIKRIASSFILLLILNLPINSLAEDPPVDVADYCWLGDASDSYIHLIERNNSETTWSVNQLNYGIEPDEVDFGINIWVDLGAIIGDYPDGDGYVALRSETKNRIGGDGGGEFWVDIYKRDAIGGYPAGVWEAIYSSPVGELDLEEPLQRVLVRTYGIGAENVSYHVRGFDVGLPCALIPTPTPMPTATVTPGTCPALPDIPGDKTEITAQFNGSIVDIMGPNDVIATINFASIVGASIETGVVDFNVPAGGYYSLPNQLLDNSGGWTADIVSGELCAVNGWSDLYPPETATAMAVGATSTAEAGATLTAQITSTPTPNATQAAATATTVAGGGGEDDGTITWLTSEGKPSPAIVGLIQTLVGFLKVMGLYELIQAFMVIVLVIVLIRMFISSRG